MTVPQTDMDRDAAGKEAQLELRKQVNEGGELMQNVGEDGKDMVQERAPSSPVPGQPSENAQFAASTSSGLLLVPTDDTEDGLSMTVDEAGAPQSTDSGDVQPERPQSPMTVEDFEVAEPLPQRSTRPSSVDPQNYTHLNRPLNVTDALSYLDAVKAQFHEQPDVYNRFLDIMKEFKNELIDTPGVIRRVSHLFHGHPSLIQGFNTFLPVGYRIECGTDAEDASYITVTTPSGTTMQSTGGLHQKGPVLLSGGSTSRYGEPSTVVGSSHEIVSTLGPASPDPRLYVSDEQAMEPAVQYVQKIKQRCDPDTYKQFLDILMQYHHKPGTMDEEEVSKQISRLFKDAPDLRSDFRVFMPERSQRLFDDDYSPPDHRMGTPGAEGRTRRRLETVAAAAASSNGTASQKRKRKALEKEKEREKDMSRTAPVAKKLKSSSSHDISTSYTTRSVAGLSRTQYQPSQIAVVSSKTMPENDHMQFFDRVKRALDNRETYNEFLKVINLFTQGFIDTARLVKESGNYLGDTELLRQFRDVLGWDERKEREHYLSTLENGWTRPIITGMRDRPGRINMNTQYGSYRKLPASEAKVPCSGRDDMCRSVLNDDWVSHPTWSSEDSGFIAHKKNIYEEALHRSEEERHEYDFHIEAIARTIAMLEPINNKIVQLSPEERSTFKLKPNLGGTLKSIHQRVIKKIYGREAGLEVVQAMQETSIAAIPVVLHRLKQKEDEWKRAQREWNKIWREVDARNYLRSLDHQAITFKMADKKAITTKALVSQIEVAREEQMAKRASLIDPLFARTRPRHQLEYIIDDMNVLQDALKLTFSFLDRTQGQISFAERRKIEGFLRIFVPLFFMLDAVTFNSAFVAVQEAAESQISGDDVQEEVEMSSVGSNGSRGGRGGRRGGSAGASVNGGFNGGDLRKKLLKSEQAKQLGKKTRTQDDPTPAASRFASPVPDTFDATQVTPGVQPRRLSRKNNFFTNTTFFVLLRQVELLYSRLRLFKNLSVRKMAESASGRATNIPKGVANALTTNSNLPEHFYELLLETCERLFDNEIEQQVFEDQMQRVFGLQDAYKVFTVDKVIGAIIKQVQAVFSDPKNQELLDILKKDRALVSPTTQDHINSRRNAEKVLGPDENLFRIDWTPESKHMTIQLLGKDDSRLDDSEVLTGRWQGYIDSYVSDEKTEGVSQARIRRPFLRRNLPHNNHEVEASVIVQPGIEIKVCVRTYRLFYVTSSEDSCWRKRTAEEANQTAKRLGTRNRLRQKWIQNSLWSTTS
ncbi:hypothetical protein AX15_005613 [Amanita polypyramis BW_CC]|nr:hypothetical protein AX15_005613 [Amanita polypyramis BW_CC]